MKKQVQLVRQHAFNDCGIAVLKMIGDYYLETDISYEEINSKCRLSARGLSVHGIRKVASEMGLKTLAVKCSMDEALNRIQLPVIALVHGFHFVVLYYVKKKQVKIMDPSQGEITLSFNEFKQIWCEGEENGEGILIIPKS